MTTSIAPLAERIQSIPLIGRPLALLVRMLYSGRAQARLVAAERHLAAISSENQNLRSEMTHLRGEIVGLWSERSNLRADTDALQSEVRPLRHAVSLSDNSLEARERTYRGDIDHVLTTMRNEWKATLARDSRALERTAAAIARQYPAPALGVADLSAPEHYVAFEDAFRARWKVEERMKWYMPHIRALYHHPESRPVLDLGCGRGEFLMELKRNGLPGVGIDLNPAMVDTSRALGLEVTLAEAVAHLRDREPASLAAIVSFHMIEHIPFDQILLLIEAAKRALMPGGLMVLETPNPENLVVGGCTFWYDPTHIRPLPPAMMHFYATRAGFDPVKTVRFFLRTDGPDVATVDQWVFPSVDGPLDYSLLATKPRNPV